MEFLRRTGLETGGTYRSALHTVFADDEWAVAIYRAQRHAERDRLDVEQALVIRLRDGMWTDVTAVPLDSRSSSSGPSADFVIGTAFAGAWTCTGSFQWLMRDHAGCYECRRTLPSA